MFFPPGGLISLNHVYTILQVASADAAQIIHSLSAGFVPVSYEKWLLLHEYFLFCLLTNAIIILVIIMWIFCYQL